jgi:hypothetical protein
MMIHLLSSCQLEDFGHCLNEDGEIYGRVRQVVRNRNLYAHIFFCCWVVVHAGDDDANYENNPTMKNGER